MFHHIDVRPKKNKGNKVLSLAGKILEWGIFSVIITAFFVIASPILPTKNFISTYIVTSGSMEPKVLAGSVALVRPARENNLKVGDVIAFTSPQDANQTILHRIYELDNGAIKTKGDNNDSADSWTIYPSSVKGRMVFTVPYIGHTAALMRTPVGFGLMMGLPVFLFMVFMFKQIKEGFEEEIEKRTRRALEKIASLEPAKVMVFLAFMLAGFSLGFAGSQTVLAKYTSLATISGISLRVKDFVPPPVPLLRSPTDNTFVRSKPTLYQRWTKVADIGSTDPVTYIYESCNNNPSLTGGVCLSVRWNQTFTDANAKNIGGEWQIEKNASGGGDGYFWWRVKAKDSTGNESAWSEVWKLTIDNVNPSKPNWVTPPNNSYTNQSQNILLDWSNSTDANLAGYEYENTGPSGSTWRSIDTCPLLIDSQIPNSQIGPGGSCINAPAGTLSVDGSYKRKVRAVDRAGNKSDWSDLWTLTRDTILPVSTINEPSAGVSYSGTPIHIAGQTTDNYGVASVQLFYTGYSGGLCGTSYSPIIPLSNPLQNTPFNWSYDWTPSISGNYCIKAQGTDLAGNSEHSPVVQNIFYHVLPQLQLTSTDDKHTISFDISDVSSFVSLYYKLTYLADGKDEGLEGAIAINGSTQIVRDLSTGSCSTDGCSFPTEIKEIKLQITLTDDMGYKSQLEKSL